jgi:hypothetical protein
MRLDKDGFDMAPTMVDRIVDLPPPHGSSASSPFWSGRAALPRA